MDLLRSLRGIGWASGGVYAFSVPLLSPLEPGRSSGLLIQLQHPHEASWHFHPTHPFMRFCPWPASKAVSFLRLDLSAAIALARTILADRELNAFAGDDAAADRGLDRI